MSYGFKTSFAGYNKEDVIAYIKSSAQKSLLEINALKEQVASLTAQIKNSQQEKCSLSSEISKLETKSINADQMQQEIERLKYQNYLLSKDLKDSQAKIDTMKKQAALRPFNESDSCKQSNSSEKELIAHDLKRTIRDQKLWCERTQIELEWFLKMVKEKLKDGEESLNRVDFQVFQNMKDDLSSLEDRINSL